MWYGKPRHARPYPFLKPAYCRWPRPSKLLPKGESCFYVGPLRDHPRDCHRVRTRVGTIQETRDVTWEALPERAEVWLLAGRGIQHIRIRANRDAMLPYGAGLDENREPVSYTHLTLPTIYSV